MSKIPFSPSEAVELARQVQIPTQIIEAFEELIVENLRHGTATIRQDAVVQRILDKMKSVLPTTKADVYDNHWLDIEDTFRATGWIVEYDKPGYNENYEPTYTFKIK